MTTITEQVSILEAEHAEALATIASLEASNAALSASNTALTAENTTLVAQADQLVRFTADTRAMVEKLSTDALDMLRATRRESYKPPEVVRFAPKPDLYREAADYIIADAAKVSSITAEQVAGIVTSAARPFGDRSTPEFQASLGDQPSLAEQINAKQPGTRTVRELVDSSAEDAEPIPDFMRRDAVFGQGPRVTVTA